MQHITIDSMYLKDRLDIDIDIYIYGLVFRVPTPRNGMGPQVAPPSLLFASYWQHFWGPASYLLGLCSISDYQPRIY